MKDILALTCLPVAQLAPTADSGHGVPPDADKRPLITDNCSFPEKEGGKGGLVCLHNIDQLD